MNYLAHIYLSFDDPDITLGNFFADHIRGNRYQHFPNNIQKGILLHRAIDTSAPGAFLVRYLVAQDSSILVIGLSWSDDDEVVAGASVIGEGIDGQTLQTAMSLRDRSVIQPNVRI